MKLIALSFFLFAGLLLTEAGKRQSERDRGEEEARKRRMERVGADGQPATSSSQAARDEAYRVQLSTQPVRSFSESFRFALFYSLFSVGRWTLPICTGDCWMRRLPIGRVRLLWCFLFLFLYSRF